MSKEKYYITTAIAYTSRVPHIGNTYEAVLADAIARYKRMVGYDVYFLTGTDEHGQKIQKQALSAGITPQEHVDHIAGEIRRIWDRMNVSYDQFIRTTDDYHVKTVQKIFKKLYEQGDIYKSSYQGHYCVACESFFTETQLVNGCCPDCGGPVELASEEAYFFKLSNYTDRLIKHIEENPDFIQPEARRNEMVNNFLKPGLSDLCVSRSSFTWGVPVEFDPGHVIYVWIDALSNYITALGYDPDGECGELYKKYWPAEVHLIGKDILRFHTLYWPIMLMALGEPLPKQVFGHPWLLMSGEKMSKSKGNVIYADELCDLFGVDAVRYYVLHEMPFASDGSLTYELLISRINSDLVNILGNLVNRTLAMVGKYFGGIVPEKTLTDADLDLCELALATPAAVEKKMSKLHVADAMDEVWALLRRSNKYIDETTPWLLAKNEEDKPRLAAVLYNLLESIRFAAVLLKPFLPETAERIFAQLNTDARDYESLSAFNGMVAGAPIGEAQPLFMRIDEAAMLAEIEKRNAPPPPPFPPIGEEISIDDFFVPDLRAAKVVSCEAVKKSDKLLKFILDIGFEQRQVVSGIAKWYKPEELVGKTVIVVANLKPVVLRGVESRGMILSVDDKDDTVRLITLPEGTTPGAKIR